MAQIQVAPITPVVKKIMIAIAAVWIVMQIVLDKFVGLNISTWFFLHPDQVIEKFWAWQLFTYMFFHALSPFHIFFNALMLYFFGSELERHWGGRFFTIYYAVCGAGAAIVYCFGVAIYAVITGNQAPLGIPVIGASGALFGLLVAYGIIFGERVVYFMGLFPMKAKYFAMIAAALDLSSLLTTGFSGGEVAYLAHLGGALVGFLFLWTNTRLKLSKTRSKLNKKGAGLRLVVDNEKLKDDKNGPKYWN
ncbi:rhomboid family intramembrane serine protease [Pseudobdellovibrio exovorus]|uniref:Integral membrane protein n=1 Tax=Pseudobdellovibrio exovorus JSS TaxID=1184267 RepID=M4V787_9BACT|nr:rhomboid family intramembrane serine protease [Pseudobdellovibrio exovorus]AGH95058.1 integral membrane protein [Pseudobdellovibrio exovorus JSS]